MELKISEPRGSSVVRTREVEFSGTAAPGDVISVESASTDVDATGRWQLDVPLAIGPDEVSVQATSEDAVTGDATVTVTRKRSDAELSRFRAARKRAGERRASEAAERKREREAAARKKARAAASRQRKRDEARASGTTSGPKITDVDINEPVSAYLSDVINDPDTAEPGIAMIALAQLARRSTGGCKTALEAAVEALRETSGGPEEIRSRVLDASFEATAECTS